MASPTKNTKSTPTARATPASPAKTSRTAAKQPTATKSPAAPRGRSPKPAKAPAKSRTPLPPLVGSEITSYPRALRYLSRLSDFERMRIVRYTSQNFDLDRMRGLLRKMGDPQKRFRSVHVAGTKGKGSTCAMAAAMLQGNGYRVGLYASPHLNDVRERITVNGTPITQADFIRFVREIEPLVAKAKLTPTYFDVLTAIAFRHFAEQKVDLAVVETGLGGRLDSTNVLLPEVTAITSISKDHTAQLGHTLTAIATEKAGIFKAGIPAVIAPQEPAVEAALRKVADAADAPLDTLGGSIEFSYRFEASRLLGRHNRVCLTTDASKFEHLACPLLGEHQAINLGVALAILDKLKARGFPINDQRATEGLEGVVMPGRMETIGHNPRVVVDCAHNAASIDAMLKAIGQNVSYDSLVVIFGCCSDKDVDGMLQRITCGADKVIFTKVNNIRSADPHDLSAKYVERYGKMSQVAETLEEAFDIARRAVSKEDLIVVTGSFYLVGEARRLFEARRKSA